MCDPTPKEVVEEVQKMLTAAGDRGGRSVQVEEDMIRFEDGWFYVIATLTAENGSALELTNLFQEIESKLENTKHWSVLIVPASPDN